MINPILTPGCTSATFYDTVSAVDQCCPWVVYLSSPVYGEACDIDGDYPLPDLQEDPPNFNGFYYIISKFSRAKLSGNLTIWIDWQANVTDVGWVRRLEPGLSTTSVELFQALGMYTHPTPPPRHVFMYVRQQDRTLMKRRAVQERPHPFFL